MLATEAIKHPWFEGAVLQTCRDNAAPLPYLLDGSVKNINIKEIDRLDWFTLRKSYLGASKAAAVLRMSPWQSPLEIYLDATAPSIDDSESGAMHWGSTLEPVIAEEYRLRTNFDVYRDPVMRIHPLYPWMSASIDRLVVNDGCVWILEIKTANAFSRGEWGPDGTDEVPKHVYVQVQHQMAVTGLKVAQVAALIGGSDFRVFNIPRHEGVINAMLPALEDFWNKNVLALKPPDPFHNSDFALRWPNSSSIEREANVEISQVYHELDAARAEEDAATERKKGLENRIKAYLADADTLTMDGVKLVTWKTSKAGTRAFRFNSMER
jgi:putative phage-type endonuclease